MRISLSPGSILTAYIAVEQDYLADGGKLLREAFDRNAEMARKMEDALSIFADCEQKTKISIEALLV